jgi:hypothetical protein
MKKEIAKKWVKALRSKKYRQARGVLKIKNKAGKTSHCCLGVLCELYQAEQRKAGKPVLPTEALPGTAVAPGIPNTSRVFEFADTSIVLPTKVTRWAGLDDDCGAFRGEFLTTHRGYIYRSLSEMNDEGCHFSTIANAIEKNVENL